MTSVNDFLGEKYVLKSSENFEEYLKFIDIGFISRKTAIAVTPTACLLRNPDGSYTFTMTTAIRNLEIHFKLDEEFVETRADGCKVNSTITMEGNKLIQVQVEHNGRRSLHIREFTPERLIVTTTADGWDNKCIRIYEPVRS